MPTLLVNDPKAMHHILVKDLDLFPKRLSPLE